MPPKYPCKRIDLLFGITITIRAERIEATSTKKGLTVTVRLNLKQYQKGITVDARISSSENIQYHPKIPKLNYRINPN